MYKHSDLSPGKLKGMIRKKKIHLAGNARLKIYGVLQCQFGKKMKKSNRVFFASATEALHQGYRPCGHCLRNEYQRWTYLTPKQ
jgi:methylphosphotriester-DNA--protein-cysteine methyltransferase